jgi:hypothetical protein
MPRGPDALSPPRPPHPADPPGTPVQGELQEGVDYTVDGLGRCIFTARHLKARGYCCFQACRHCPWGQAGRTRAAVFADLQGRLDRLEEAIRAAGVDSEVSGYSMGVVRLVAPRAACSTDQGALTEVVRRCATDVLTMVDVEWV